ncbi:Tim44-domain-containing protein [Testicularia cyperi]|uniref:Mitochondrial import inner membrane translocase subunit TIM44 n=1 Tax=Testicularia cyperi TaxID=1882483 RepID=A0A317XIS5_9BASI|nr:Tim44-domain-containing protein [Testicularia cyperi]
MRATSAAPVVRAAAVRISLRSGSNAVVMPRRSVSAAPIFAAASQRSSALAPTATGAFSTRREFSSSRPRSDAPRSPFAVFVETLKTELRKNQELQENMRQLSGDVGKMQDSETMKKMREAYERARIITSIKENPKLQAAADALKKSGGQVGDAVGTALRQMEDSELIKGLGAISTRLARQLEDSTAPIRNTEAYKQLSETLTEAFDDGGSALRIYVDKEKDAVEVRRIKREARLRKIGRPMPSKDVDSAEAAEAVLKSYAAKEDPEAGESEGAAAEETAKPAEEAEQQASSSSSTESAAPSPSSSAASEAKPAPKKPAGYAVRVRSVTENADAGQALVLRPEPAYKQAWASFKSSNPLMRKFGEMQEAYNESENPLIERVRGVTDWFGSLFEENEFAKVTRHMKMMDPSFTVEAFQRDLREYIVPEIIDSYHGAARHLLRQWCGEATFNLLMATLDPYLQKGMLPEGRLLDLKGIEILQAKILENNIPVLVVSFTSQELMFFKDPKDGSVKAGNDKQPDLCRYAMVLTRVEEELDNEITGGWKVVELARRGQAAYL